MKALYLFCLFSTLAGAAVTDAPASVQLCRISNAAVDKVKALIAEAPVLCTETKAGKTLSLTSALLKKMKGQVFVMALGSGGQPRGLQEAAARVCAEEWGLFHGIPKGDPLPNTRGVQVSEDAIAKVHAAHVFTPMTCETRPVHK